MNELFNDMLSKHLIEVIKPKDGDKLIYASYKFNRLHSPEVSPERWSKVFAHVDVMEQVFQMELLQEARKQKAMSLLASENTKIDNHDCFYWLDFIKGNKC